MPSTQQSRAPSVAEASEEQRYNLNGQKIGRKGRDTRDRILAAAAELIAEASETPVTLSAVARRVSLGMTSLYLYFNDFTELLLAVLEPVMATTEQEYIGHLREHWPDETLNQHCFEFVSAYHAFWAKNSPLLHLRNSMADQRDKRLMQQRIGSTQPVIRLLVGQMEGDPARPDPACQSMASVLMTGIERVVTVSTDAELPKLAPPGGFIPNVGLYVQSEARLLEFAIAEYRAIARRG